MSNSRAPAGVSSHVAHAPPNVGILIAQRDDVGNPTCASSSNTAAVTAQASAVTNAAPVTTPRGVNETPIAQSSVNNVNNGSSAQNADAVVAPRENALSGVAAGDAGAPRSIAGEESGARDANDNVRRKSGAAASTSGESDKTRMEKARGKKFIRNANLLDCVMCRWKCKDDDTLRQHFLTHCSDESTKCPMCEAEFDSIRLMQDHFCETYGGLDKIQCPHCDKKFYLRRVLNSHISQKHPDTLEVTLV